MSRIGVILPVVATAQALHGCDHRDDPLRMWGRDRSPGIMRAVVELVRLHIDTLEVFVERITGDAAFLQCVQLHDLCCRIDWIGRDRNQAQQENYSE